MAKAKVAKIWRDYLKRAADLLAKQKPNKYFKIPGDGKFKFEMGTVISDRPCGTAGCILGVMKTLAAVDLQKSGVPSPKRSLVRELAEVQLFMDIPSRLHPLFYPKDNDIYEAATPKGAAKTVRRFLRTGRVKWVSEEQV